MSIALNNVLPLAVMCRAIAQAEPTAPREEREGLVHGVVNAMMQSEFPDFPRAVRAVHDWLSDENDDRFPPLDSFERLVAMALVAAVQPRFLGALERIQLSAKAMERLITEANIDVDTFQALVVPPEVHAEMLARSEKLLARAREIAEATGTSLGKALAQATLETRQHEFPTGE